jgi:hypothetical protein
MIGLIIEGFGKSALKLIILFLLLAASALAADIRALIQKCKPAVVQIGVFDGKASC